MKKLLFFFLSITIFVFSSCKREVDAINPALLLIDSLMQSRPDSSLYLLEQFSDLQKIKNADKAFYNLLLTQARYKNYVLQNDSSIQIAIDYYKNNEILENSYYQIPQELFVNSLYKEKLNSDSKILYAFLLDRLSLSQKNHWFDEYGRVYLIFTREEVQSKLCLSEKTVTKAFKQLLGKPNLIYVGKIQHEEIISDIEQDNIQILNSKNYGSGKVKNTTLDTEILPTINPHSSKTNIINTDSINLQSNEEYISL